MIDLGLEQYWPAFYENSYTEPRDLADIKYLPADSISAIFGIKKEAHLKKLKMATSVLQYPTKGFWLFWIPCFTLNCVYVKFNINEWNIDLNIYLKNYEILLSSTFRKEV